MQFIDSNEEPVENIKRLFHAALARQSGIEVEERTFRGVLQSNFGVHEFFHLSSNFNSNQSNRRNNISTSRVDNRLVRYQGVIQDIFNPEYYTAGIFLNRSNEANHSDRFILGKYQERINGPQFDEDQGSVVTLERTVAFLNFCEGTSRWLYSRNDAEQTNNGRKRLSDFSPASDHKKKIQLISPGEGGHHEGTMSFSSSSPFPFQDQSSLLASEQITSASPHNCCLVKFYDVNEDETFRINDMVEVIGLYSIWRDAALDIDSAASNGLSQCLDMLDDEAFESVALNRHPAPEICPRVHCLSFRKLGSTFPLLFHPQLRSSDLSYPKEASFSVDSTISPPYSRVASEMLTDSSKRVLLETREKIIALLTEVCQGDALCGNYLLLAILSGAISSSSDGYIVLRMVSAADITAERKKRMMDSLAYVLSKILPRCVQMRSDSLPPPPTKHLDAVSVCSCCSPTSPTADAAFIPFAKSWHLGPGSLVLLTESADQTAPQSYSVDFFRELVFERTMRVRIRDGIFYSSDTHIPVHLSFVLLSDVSCLTSECSLLGADDDIHPAVVTTPLAAEGALLSSDASGGNECDRDYVILSEDEDEDDERSADNHFTAQTVPQFSPNLSSSSSSSSSSSLPRSLTAVEESEWIAMRVWCSLCVSIAQQHMGTLTMDDRLQAAAEQDFVSTRQLHKQDPSQHPNLSEVGFHRWLRLVRLIAATSFETESISLQHWVKMRSMEYRRLQRTVASHSRPSHPLVHIID